MCLVDYSIAVRARIVNGTRWDVSSGHGHLVLLWSAVSLKTFSIDHSVIGLTLQSKFSAKHNSLVIGVVPARIPTHPRGGFADTIGCVFIFSYKHTASKDKTLHGVRPDISFGQRERQYIVYGGFLSRN